jgi:hypothetical protein
MVDTAELRPSPTAAQAHVSTTSASGCESPRCDPRSPFEICNECRTELGIFNGTPVGAAGMGAFEVPADKITAWRDYFYVEA